MRHKIIPLILAAFASIALPACEDDTTIINPDPGHPSTAPDASATSKAILSSAYCPDTDIVLFNIGNPENENLAPDDLGRSDQLTLILPAPLDHDLTLRVGMEPNYANNVQINGGSIAWGTCNKFQKEHYYRTVFSDEKNQGLINHFSINGDSEAIITIKAGQTQSNPLQVDFTRSDLRWGLSYLFPIQATDIATGELYAETFYVVTPIDENPSIIGQRPAVFVAYIDTEVMNPLITDKFIYELATDDFNTGDHNIIYYGPYFEILNLRTSTIKEVAGMPTISLTADLEYVLKNRNKYLAPMQKNGLKICLSIKGGNTGLGFSNMTDEQISKFVSRAKVLVDMYSLDGINIWDENAGYDIDGAAEVNPESYAKLIKALKTAMPGKLLTLVDTRETTEALCDPVAGISVGDYLDYAWSSLETFLLPYEPGSSTRPLANLSEKKYGSLFMRDPMLIPEEILMGWDEDPVFSQYMMGLNQTPLTGTDVFVVYDIPFMDYGKEGVWAFGLLWEPVKYPTPEDFSTFTMGQLDYPYYMRDY